LDIFIGKFLIGDFSWPDVCWLAEFHVEITPIQPSTLRLLRLLLSRTRVPSDEDCENHPRYPALYSKMAGRPQNLRTARFGYGSIPIHTIFRGMNIHLPAILMFTRGTGF
jgi:hypothetical protein